MTGAITGAMTGQLAGPRRRPFALATGVALALALAFLWPGLARAHELRPALLSLTEVGPGEYEVAFRVPADVAGSQAPVAILPAGSARAGDAPRTREGDTVLERFHARVPGGLAGRRLAVRFAGGVASEVLVRIATRDGRTLTGRLLPGPGIDAAEWLVPAAPTARLVAETYLRLGVEHILTGIDHLAFVLGLILLTPAWRRLWKTVTAFTAAHSLTLALAALGIVRVPPPPIEAAIALSILFVAREVWLAQRGQPGWAARRPWPIAFAFGLLHGLGFAGALAQVGLPESDIPLALLTFNVGVELGQLAFVAAVLLVLRAAARAPLAARVALAEHPRLRLLPSYAIGAMAAFWCIERIVRFWT